MTGKLIAIAIRPERRAPMETRERIKVRQGGGLVGDHAGDDPDRLVTVLSKESWADACASLAPPADPENELPWLTRRANLLIEGLRLPRAAGALLRVGEAELEVTQQTYPCKRMEEARAGLLKALAQDWRGGVLCKVRRPGEIAIDDRVEIVPAPEEMDRKLP